MAQADHRPFPAVRIKNEDEDEILDIRDNLEYEENPLIKMEQEVLLEPWRRRPQPPVPVIYLPVADTPFFDLFVEQFVVAFAPDDRDDCGKSSAIRKAGSERMFSSLLNEAFQAVSVAHFAQCMGSGAAAAYGHRVYSRVLGHLQNALIDPQQSRSSGVLATVILLMAYESLQHTSPHALINHCVGALKLIEFRNPWNHMFGVEHLCFAELLPYWVCTALVLRKPTFLARKEWKVVPWSASGSYKDIMACLLEQVVDLPAILWRHDQYRLALRTLSKSPNELDAELVELWTSIRQFEASLLRWKRDWVDNHPSGPPVESDSQGADPFPIFRYHDPNTLDIITPPTLVYQTPLLAHALCMYYAAMLVLASIDLRPGDRISTPESLGFVHMICRSLEYYIRAVPGNMINRLAFPLRVAYDSLPEDHLERRFIEEIFLLVERKKALRSWGRFIPDISTKM